jgi:predicted acyl esterase
LRAASEEKWLEVHGLEHWTHFYTDYGRRLQRSFFDCYLKGEDNGWRKRDRVQLQVRHLDRFEDRSEAAWPLPRTAWSKFYLDPDRQTLTAHPPAGRSALSFDAGGDGLTFLSEPLPGELEITGPLAAGLRISSSTPDADIFLVLRAFTADLREIVFTGAIDPHTPLAQGWLRASHRKLDEKLSKPWRPYHSHDRRQPLVPGDPVELQIEIWPTCIVLPAGCRIALSVRGRDYQWQKSTGLRLSNFKNELTGCGPFLHDDPRDRPRSVFGGRTTLHFDTADTNFLLLPIIPRGK